MADTDPVSVTVEIVDNFSDDIARLKGELESLEKDVGVTLDIDDDGDIDWAKAELEKLDDIIEVLLDINTSDIKKTKAELELLDNTVTSSRHNVDVHRDGDQFDPPTLGKGMNFGDDLPGADVMKSQTKTGPVSSPGQLVSNVTPQDLGISIDRRMMDEGRFKNMGLPFSNDRVGRKSFFGLAENDAMQAFRDTFKGADLTLEDPRIKSPGAGLSKNPFANYKSGSGMDFPSNSGDLMESLGFEGTPMDQADLRNRDVPNGGSGDGLFGFLDGFDSTKGGKAKGGSGGFLEGLMKKVKPSMRKWTNLLAMLLPMIITLAAAVGGLIAAFGGLAIAGAAAFAFGAWGLDDFQAKLNDLKSDLSGLFEPVKEMFAPFVDRFMDLAPSRMKPLVDAFTSLSGFEGLISDSFVGLVNWVSKAITRMSNFRREISDILGIVGSAFGDSIINFMQFLVETTAENRVQFLRLASVLGNIVAIIFNVSKVVSFAIANFDWLFAALAKVSAALSNKFVVGLLTAIATGFAFYKILQAIVWIMSGSLIASIGKALAGLYNLITTLSVAAGISWSLAAGIAAATAGLAALAGIAAMEQMKNQTPGPSTGGMGGPMGGSPSGSANGGSGDTYINIEGNADKDALNKMNQAFDDKWDTYSGREETRDTS